MNKKQILRYCGILCLAEAAFMLLPLLVALIYRESAGLWFLPVVAGLCLIGVPLYRLRPARTEIYARDGFLIVALGWIVISLFGCLPFFFSRQIPSFLDAFFETVSGFTTTGSSILPDVEALSKCMLFWRSFAHWAGGMGVLVFLLAILPTGSGSVVHILRAESPGPTVEKFTPKMGSTAKIMYIIYLVMTVLLILLLLVGGMNPFDAVVNSFSVAGTGGLSVRNEGIAAYDSFYLQGVMTTFMILFGVNFNLYYLLLLGKVRTVWKSEELRAYLLTILAATVLITLNVRSMYGTLFEAFHDSAFTVSSIISTTGFTVTDFNLWPTFSKTILVLLMFIGASAGSTGGGLKVSRVIIALKSAAREISSLLHPRQVRGIRMNGKKMEEETVRRVNGYLVIYAMIFLGSLFLLSLEQFDFETNFTAVAANINNVGPGLAVVGPTCNYAGYSWFSKLVLILDMLIGRLEIYPMLVLLAPGAHRRR